MRMTGREPCVNAARANKIGNKQLLATHEGSYQSRCQSRAAVSYFVYFQANAQ